MKKFLTMMIGLGLVLGTASVSFGQAAPADTHKKEKKAKTKKAGKKKGMDDAKGADKK